MSRGGRCHVCGKETPLFHFTHPFDLVRKHEGFYHCALHDSDWLEQNTKHRRELEERIMKYEAGGDIKPGDLQIESNVDGTFTIVDYRPDPPKEGLQLKTGDVIPLNRAERRKLKK